MQIFISYRREDTAGRAGRLFDALVARFGARNVFQDVTAITPGADFDQAIASAIDRCDVALVIIGRDWTTVSGPDGRRLDTPGDYVRREVSTALSEGVPVVPVLVGGASMPSTEQLPEDLEPLSRRQAVTIRDDTWHQDIDALVRRLQHDEVVGSPPSRRPVIVAAAALASVIVVALAGWLWLGRGDDGGDDDGATDDALTGCPAPTPEWTTIAVAPGASATADDDGDVQLRFTVRSAAFDPQERRIFVDVEVRNESDPANPVVPYYSEAFFNTVLVDGLAQGDAQCLSVEGDPNLHPGQRAIGLVGYDLSEDPAGRPLVLELMSGSPDISITP